MRCRWHYFHLPASSWAPHRSQSEWQSPICQNSSPWCPCRSLAGHFDDKSSWCSRAHVSCPPDRYRAGVASWRTKWDWWRSMRRSQRTMRSECVRRVSRVEGICCGNSNGMLRILEHNFAILLMLTQICSASPWPWNMWQSKRLDSAQRQQCSVRVPWTVHASPPSRRCDEGTGECSAILALMICRSVTRKPEMWNGKMKLNNRRL